MVMEQAKDMADWERRFAATPREKYIMAMSQLQNAAKLLGGELTETACYDHTGQASNRFIITYSVRKRDDVDPYKVGDPPGSEHSPTLQKDKKDYEGPLYAPHPDLEQPFDTEAYRHFKDVVFDDHSDPYGGT